MDEQTRRKPELKRCPFCGGEAELKRLSACTAERGHISIILDRWEVRCKEGDCSTQEFVDHIYHADNGEVVAEKNGAEAAVEAWNHRASADIADNEPPIENKPEE